MESSSEWVHQIRRNICWIVSSLVYIFALSSFLEVKIIYSCFIIKLFFNFILIIAWFLHQYYIWELSIWFYIHWSHETAPWFNWCRSISFFFPLRLKIMKYILLLYEEYCVAGSPEKLLFRKMYIGQIGDFVTLIPRWKSLKCHACNN